MELSAQKPAWLKVPIPHGNEFREMNKLIQGLGLATVCTEARCPNKSECWNCGTATFMVLGDICTRNCRFCAVSTQKAGQPVNNNEPQALAKAIHKLKLTYAVITSVDRDDLPNRGAEHFAACIHAIHTVSPQTKVEVLIPDYYGAELDAILTEKPDVIAHNIETVPSLQHIRDCRASLEASLRTLKEVKHKSSILTKSSIMLGLGETTEEILLSMDILRQAGCDIVVLGQYLQPTRKQLPVSKYYTPQEFDELAQIAYKKGFLHVVSAPLARTSYHAHQSFPIQQVYE